MQNPDYSPPLPELRTQSRPTQMTSLLSGMVDDPGNSSPFDWSDLLEFSLDEQLNISFDHGTGVAGVNQLHQEQVQPAAPVLPSSEESPLSDGGSDPGRVRKRDPRSTCTNYLAGRIPCACPELDEKMEEEELGGLGPGKKRARTVRASAGAAARCQVPDCEADISELKGYHKRHRVCLRCANASTVFLDGHSKRYCQQCGKFHILSDFDEGKRSCRRKLERHNNRRRRKATDSSKESVEKESQQVTVADDVSFDDDIGKDSTCMGSQLAERQVLLESEGHIPTLCSFQGTTNNQSDSFTASGETQVAAEKENSKYTDSPSYYDDKSAFSSVCPTGRISFKLYDWNPAEFPRRLRHQIFQWLASMPVELEGYIRPGCTILTIFVAMPTVKWGKLLEDPAAHLYQFLASHGNILRGRGDFLVYLNNMVFRITKGGNSVSKVKLKGPAPELQFVYPTCFEAGKPMEFFASGTNLLQPRFRFLVSFGGKYLENDISITPSCCKTEGCSCSMEHQLLKIHIPRTEANFFGPAFVEVENESGLSNFIPIFIADKDICAEMKEIQQKFWFGGSQPKGCCPCDNSMFRKTEFSKSTAVCCPCDNSMFRKTEFSSTAVCCPCDNSMFRKTEFSEFMLDVAWLLREPSLENAQLLASVHMQRYKSLLKLLMETQSTNILKRVMYCLESRVERNLLAGNSDGEMSLFKRNTDVEKSCVGDSRQVMLETNSCCQIFQNHNKAVFPFADQDLEVPRMHNLEGGLTYLDKSTTVPLLDADVLLRVRDHPGKPCGRLLRKTVLTSRSLVFAICGVAVCFGLCAAFLHPRKVNEIAITIRRCLFDAS